MFEDVLKQIGVVAVFVERLVQFLKLTRYNEWAAKYQKYIDVGLSLLFNILLCYAWNIDVFAIAGIAIGYGSILTGVLAGLGSEIIHEVVELLKLWRKGPVLG